MDNNTGEDKDEEDDDEEDEEEDEEEEDDDEVWLVILLGGNTDTDTDEDEDEDEAMLTGEFGTITSLLGITWRVMIVVSPVAISLLSIVAEFSRF